MKIGYIGTGLMGRPMAGHLQRAGFDLMLLPNRTPAPSELVSGGAVVADSAASLAAWADVVMLNVPDTPDVEDLLFRADGIASGANAGLLVIDNSTISPAATRRFAERLAEQGVRFVDAPVSGGDVGARDATLTIMVGGQDEDVGRAMPLLRLLGKTITHIGEVGAGQTCKAANQIVVGVTLAAVAEALVFAGKAGADPVKVREALLGGFAGSRILEKHGQRMLDADFAPGFKTHLHAKDLAIVLDNADELGVELPATALVREHLLAQIAAGGSDADHSVLVREVERAAGYPISGPAKDHTR